MITWHTLTYSTRPQYENDRYTILLRVEEIGGVPATRPYLDSQSKPAPTMGVGFNLTVARNLNEVLREMGFDLRATGAELNYIEFIRAAVGLAYATGANDALRTNLDAVMTNWAADSSVTTHNGKSKRTDFTLSTTEVRTVFDAVAPDYEGDVNRWAARFNLGAIPDSPERIALLSLAWNSPDKNRDGIPDLLGDKLGEACRAGNRAEAWYEIRYGSNANQARGVAKRRYYESELFGLYNGTGNPPIATLTEAQQVYRMFALHRSEIERYEQRYGVDFEGNAGWERINGRPPLGAANYEFNLSGAAAVDAIHDALDPAWRTLFAELQRLYPTGMAGLSATDFSPVNVQLDPNRNVGQPVTTNTPDHQSYLDGRRFNSQGQEISTRDILIGEGGRDILRGGLGDDVLIGGEGDDIYIYRAGDGNDRIIDEDRRGRILLFDANGQSRELVAGPFFQQNPNGGNIWQSADGQISITHNSPWQLVLADGSTIELGEEFQDGDFGIDLVDAALPVDTTRTIQGDREWQVFYAPAELAEGASPLPTGGPLLPGAEWTVTLNPPVNPQNPDWANWRLDPEQTTSVLVDSYDYLGWTVREYRITSATWAYNQLDELGNLIATDTVVAQADGLHGSAGNDRILAGEGDDEIEAKAGADRAELGAGDDLLYANAELDPAAALAAGESQSFQDGESGWLDGGAGEDRLSGDAGADILLDGGRARMRRFGKSQSVRDGELCIACMIGIAANVKNWRITV